MKKVFFISLALALTVYSCTKDAGTISLDYTKATAVYGDLDEIRERPLIQDSRSIINPGKIYVGTEVLLIGEENEGIHVFDNSNPSNPVNILFIQLPFTKEFFVEENIIYAESHYDMVKIDIQNKYNPILEDRLEFALSDAITNNQGQTLVGFNFQEISEKFKINSPEYNQLENTNYLYYNYVQNLIPASAVPASFAGNGDGSIGSVNRIAKQFGHVYAISNSKIHVFSDNMAGLELVNSNGWIWGTQMETIYAEDEHLFIGSRNSVSIYDISNPESPSYVSEFWHATSCDPVLPNDNVAYTTLRTGDFADCPGDENALITLDITTIINPINVDEQVMISPYGMSIINDQLYVGEGENGMKIFDLSDPFHPNLVNFDQSVAAYDIISHPTIDDLILTAGPNGIEQYEMDEQTFNLTFISSINY